MGMKKKRAYRIQSGVKFEAFFEQSGLFFRKPKLFSLSFTFGAEAVGCG